jgi:putative DNA primase/helicase
MSTKTAEAKKEQLYLDVQKKLINLMIDESTVTQDLYNDGVTPEFFSPPYQTLAFAIFENHLKTNGKCKLTPDHYRSWLVQRGAKGDITIAMNTFHECEFGVHWSNSPDDYGLLLEQLRDQFLHRQQLLALKEFNDNLAKLGRNKATKIQTDKLAAINQAIYSKGFELIDADFSKAEPIEWVIDKIIPARKITIIQGLAGKGKSLICGDFAARITSGTSFCGKSVQQGSILYVTSEDGINDTLIPRFKATGFAVENNIKFLNLDKKYLDLSKDLYLLEQTLKQMGNVKLIVIDPLSAFLGQTRTMEDAQVRQVLGQVKVFCEKMNVAVLCIMHLTKDRNKDITQRALGSTAFGAQARVIWHVEESNGVTYFSHAKYNIVECQGNRPFTIKRSIQDDPNSSPVIVWQNDVNYDKPHELFANSANMDGNSTLAEVVEWLKEQLQTGKEKQSTIQNNAESVGYSIRTLRRAKEELKIKPKKIGSIWYWDLPQQPIIEEKLNF